MESFSRDDLPAVIDTGTTQIRAFEAGEMVMLFYRFKKGADLRRYLRGLPGDNCNCPHWSYVLSGKLRIHTADGAHDVTAGQAFYVEPGHYPEALEDSEMFEVSPAKATRAVGEHLLRQLQAEHPEAGAAAH